MKKIFTLLAAIFITASVFAQTPEKMSYQAVVRNGTDALIKNTQVGMQISILQGSITGTPVYEETQTPTTNANGLVSIEIGSGTVVSGTFSTIDWSNGPYFIKTETDPTGGTSYTISGTSQLMSVPYALHAKTAESISGGINETDPVFGASIANGITAVDTAHWSNHTVDTDTHIDSTGINALGYVTGAHTIDTDTHIDSAGINALGYVAGAHTVDTDTHLDSAGINALGYVAGAHTINTDTQLDSAGINALGYVAGAHTVDTDTHIDSTGINALGYVAGAHTVDTDTHLDSAGVNALGYVAGAHTVDTDTHLDSAGVNALGYVAGAHTIDTDTHIDSTGINALGYVAGAHTIDTDTHIDSTGINALGYVAGAHTIDTDTHIDSNGIDALGYVAGAHTIDTDTHIDSTGIAALGFVTSTEVDGSETKLTAGDNISLTGTGTTSNPYIVNGITSMTQVQRDSLTVVEGLIVYNNTTHQPNYYNGTEWMNYDGSSAATPPAAGDTFQGGVIAYVFQPGDPGYVAGETHGLIAAPSDQSSGITWYNGTYPICGAVGLAIGTGNSNTNLIVAVQGPGNYAASLCANLVLGGYSDWYLPSKDELNLLYLNRVAIGGFASTGTNFNVTYRSSSEDVNDGNGGKYVAWSQNFSTGAFNNNTIKYYDMRVRAVRSF